MITYVRVHDIITRAISPFQFYKVEIGPNFRFAIKIVSPFWSKVEILGFRSMFLVGRTKFDKILGFLTKMCQILGFGVKMFGLIGKIGQNFRFQVDICGCQVEILSNLRFSVKNMSKFRLEAQNWSKFQISAQHFRLYGQNCPNFGFYGQNSCCKVKQ